MCFVLILNTLRSRLIVLQYVFRGAGSVQRALAAKIATSWYLRLISACRERLSDFEATNTGSFSQRGEDIKGRSQEP